MKSVIESILKEEGPLEEWEVITAVAERQGSANGGQVLDELEFGPFVKDDSGRWHLSAEAPE